MQKILDGTPDAPGELVIYTKIILIGWGVAVTERSPSTSNNAPVKRYGQSRSEGMLPKCRAVSGTT